MGRSEWAILAGSAVIGWVRGRMACTLDGTDAGHVQRSTPRHQPRLASLRYADRQGQTSRGTSSDRTLSTSTASGSRRIPSVTAGQAAHHIVSVSCSSCSQPAGRTDGGWHTYAKFRCDVVICGAGLR